MALNASQPELFAAVTSSPELLITVLATHVITGTVFFPEDFPGENIFANAAAGLTTTIVADGEVTVSASLDTFSMVTASVVITAGVIHEIDQVSWLYLS
jgi:uncharacterized surface protein with fasciclin (FAS1) repeats